MEPIIMDGTNQIKAPGYLRVSKVIAYIMYAWTLIGVITLSLRVFLLAFSANSTTPFVKFIYNTSADYLEPFRGIFPAKPVGQTGYLDIAALFAIIIYLLIMWGFSELISYLQYKIDQSKKQQREQQKVRLATQTRSPKKTA